MEENRIPKIYQTTKKIAFSYSALLVIYAIYHQFFYAEGTWVHGFTANGFAVLSGIIWIGILLIFKRFLNQILNYFKANLLINSYAIFLAIATFSTASVLYKSIRVYSSLEDVDSLNSFSAFASSSILGAILVLVSNFVIILICIFLGNRIRKIDLIAKSKFKILGFALIIYSVISLLASLNYIQFDSIQFLFLAVVVSLIGLIFKEVNETEPSVLNSMINYQQTKNIKPKPLPKTKEEKLITRKKPITKIKGKKINGTENKNTIQEELPNTSLNDNKEKEAILSYYENLPSGELSRLEEIIKNKYQQTLNANQIEDLVKYYIAEKRLYDHKRFMPK